MAYNQNQQKFAKNLNTPPKDSPLWLVGDAWKRSNSTGQDYCPINNIIDDELLVVARKESRKPVSDPDPKKERDYIHKPIEVESEDGVIDEVDYFYYVTDFNGNGKFSIFGFDNEAGAKKKKEEAIKFAGYNKSIESQQSLNNDNDTLTSTLAPKKTTITVNGANKTVDQVANQVMLKQDEVLTYTDPQLVAQDNIEQKTALMEDGYDFIPSSLVRNNVWETEVTDAKGKTTKTVIFLMGKIINVKAKSKDSINNGPEQ